jgi:hypothetical protein
MERLEKLLTPEQFESLPKGNRGGQGGMGGMWGNNGPIKLSDLPQQAQDRMKQYDKNNDGTIDDTERQAMMEDFRQRGGPGMMMGNGGGGQGGGGQGGGRGGRGNGGGGNGGAPAGQSPN